MTLKIVYKVLIAAAYAFLFWFVFYYINPLCYNIFQQPAFVVTADFFWSKVNVPGGLAEYLQTFIDQFTMFRFWGTLFLVAELLLTAFLIARYVRKIVTDNQYVNLLAYLLPVAVAFVAWTDVKYAFAINMQVLLLAAVLNLQQALSKFDWHKYLTPLLAIAVYHACGPVALYTFALCCIIACALRRDKSEIVSVVGTVVVAALWPSLVYKFMLPVKPNAAFYDMRPQEQMFIVFDLSAVLYLLYLFIPLMMLLAKAYVWLGSEKKRQIVTIALVVLSLAASKFGQHKRDQLPERMGFKMEVAAYNNDWNQIVNLVKQNESLKQREKYSQMVNFYYNMALAAKGQMGDKMFSYPQRLGINGLFINEPMATISCLPMAMLFHQAGLATNALHYAFEAQSTYTSSHYVMPYVVDNLLIIGDYQNASKYLEKYSHVLFSGKYVEDRKKYIEGERDTEFARSVDNIRSKHPQSDFYMANSQYDMLKIVNYDKDNQFATQYLIASALLQGDLDMFMKLILGGYTNLNYNSLPRAYQEAVLLYRSLYKEVLPGTEKPQVQPYIAEQFKSFQQIMSRQGNNARSIVESRYIDTYWGYYFFVNPNVTGVSVRKK